MMKFEDPVAGRCKRHAFAATSEGEDFGGQEPEVKVHTFTQRCCHKTAYQGIGPHVKP